MKTNEITQQMKKNSFTRKLYLGTFPADKIPKRPQKNSCFISNTHPHTKPGQHWVAVYVNHKGIPYYYDPYGIPPISIYHLKFLNRASEGRWFFNSKQVQSLHSRRCGWLCISFLIKACRTKSPKQVVQNMVNMNPLATDRVLNSRVEQIQKRKKK